MRTLLDIAAGAALAASVSSVTSASASLTTGTGSMAASVSSVTTASASLTAAIGLAASVSSVTTSSASLTAAIALAASVTSVTTASASLTAAIALASSVNAVTTASASLTAGSGANLGASVTSVTTASASLTAAIGLAASVSSVTSASAAITVVASLAASVHATSSVSATLTAGITTPANFMLDLLAYLNTQGIVAYPSHIPQGYSFPALVFTKISGDSEYMLAGLAGIREVHIQFSSISSRYTDLETAQTSLLTALKALKHSTIGNGTVVECVVAGNEAQDYVPPVDASDDGTYSLLREYTFYYDEAQF